MATTVAAMKGRLGSTDYFIISMKAKELVEKAIIPTEMDGWDELTLEEKYQRDINYTRVKNQIAPYLAKDKDRFFGAIILTARNFDPSGFEPVKEVVKKDVLNLYKVAAECMGFLTFSGGEQLIPLDGQHRLKAIQFALEGKDEKSNKIPNMQPCSDLANEDITVILVPYEKKKARKIFTKVNRYANPTTPGQNIVTDDDDFIAVSARMVANDIIGPDLVKYRGTEALSDAENYFTTLKTIANCNTAIIDEHFPGNLDRTRPIEDGDRREMYVKKITDIWTHLIDNIDEFSDMLEDRTDTGMEKRCEIRTDYLLGKPIPQVCLLKAFVRLTASNAFSYKEASDALNRIDWRKDALHWDRLLMSGNKILTKNQAIAARVIYYMAGGKLNEQEEKNLLADYQKLFPDIEQPKHLPSQV